MQEPATCVARPAQQASLQIESADTDAMGTLTERSVQRSSAPSIGLAVRIKGKGAVLVRIFQSVQLSSRFGSSTLSHWRRNTKAKSNCGNVLVCCGANCQFAICQKRSSN